MKLHEKILYYRKRSGLSQEELAARVGVSRQAVSKWELNEATPDSDKLLPLARAFGVTVDELLSDADPAPEAAAPEEPAPSAPERDSSSLPGWLGRMARRWGWLAGVYVALSGLGIAVVGAIARYAFGQMFRVTAQDFFQAAGFGSFAPDITGQFTVGVSSMGQVFVTIATVILVVGVAVTLAGAVLAIWLYRRGNKKS